MINIIHLSINIILTNSEPFTFFFFISKKLLNASPKGISQDDYFNLLTTLITVCTRIWGSRCDLVVFVFQCASLVEWGESFVFHVVSRDFQLEQPKPSVTCQHGVDRRVCDGKVLQKHAHLHCHIHIIFKTTTQLSVCLYM